MANEELTRKLAALRASMAHQCSLSVANGRMSSAALFAEHIATLDAAMRALAAPAEAEAGQWVPMEDACKAVYWARGRVALMDDDELGDLWIEDKDRFIADCRTEFAMLLAAPPRAAPKGE